MPSLWALPSCCSQDARGKLDVPSGMAEVEEASNSLAIKLALVHVELAAAVDVKQAVVCWSVTWPCILPHALKEHLRVAVAGKDHQPFLSDNVAPLEELALIPRLHQRFAHLQCHLGPTSPSGAPLPFLDDTNNPSSGCKIMPARSRPAQLLNSVGSFTQFSFPAVSSISWAKLYKALAPIRWPGKRRSSAHRRPGLPDRLQRP